MSLLYFKRSNNNQQKVKIAGFDFDNTLVKTLSGKKFPINEDDWKYIYPNILDKLNTLKDNYCLVIFSNQYGVGLGKTDRFTKIINSTKLGWHLYAALNKDGYRKPNTMMWKFMENNFDIDKDNSFYVGDAAGRIKGWSNNKKAKKDFLCSDRKFASNIGIKIFTLEEYFLNQEPIQDYSL
jgi:bifunctional polynucleotide phosphatase/kinase